MLPFSIFADEVRLTDGSILMGTVEFVDGELLVLSHPVLGELRIPRTEIDSMITDSPVYYRFADGSVVGEKLVVEQDALINDMGQIDAVWQVDDEAPDVLAARMEEEARRTKWSLTLGVDLRGSRGNTDETKYGINVVAVRSNLESKLKLYGRYKRANYGDYKTEDETILGFNYDAYVFEKFGLYGRSEFEKDEFESIDLRSTYAAGVNYRFFKTDAFSFMARAGLSYRNEDYIDESSKDYPGADVGYELEWSLSRWMKLTNNLSYLPSFEDFNDFVVRYETSVEIPIGQERNWSINLGMYNDYNNQPTDEDYKLDTNYYTRISLKWE
ncbi:MAG: DUF481 domain-containing protein [Opitutales bacterium]|nr:DUF481 domain-containing protein [Opitutales bacterium]